MRSLVLAIAALSLCLTAHAAAKKERAPKAKPETPAESVPPAAAPSTPAANGPMGEVTIDITDLISRELPAKVELRNTAGGDPISIDAPKGRAHGQFPVGKYHADIYVYSAGLPFLVHAKEVVVSEKQPASILLNLAPGSSGKTPLQAFDRDLDLALDSVEQKEGTDPNDASSVPHKQKLTFPAPVLAKQSGWYRGELHAHSSYGEGRGKNTESVPDLVERAEKAGLDFLAITDRNTLAACTDPGFKSDRVALIPAMEWGSDKEGVALIYGPRTMPDIVHSQEEGQAVLRLLQAQGGVFAVAHPCFPTAPWQWGLQFVNAIEVWCRDWRGVPPMNVEQLTEPNKLKVKTRFAYSIAEAASMNRLSANGQAVAFWDSELARQLRACAIAGSSTTSPKVAMGAPITCVYAKDKSWPAILEGIRLGRTYISSGPEGPTIQFCADVKKDGKIDISMGGVAPLGVLTELQVIITRAKGRKVEVLRNGLPIIAQKIEDNAFIMKFDQIPLDYSVYRVQVIGEGPAEGFGGSEVLAMSSPVYFDDIIVVRKDLDPEQAWIKIQTKYQEEFNPDMFVPPSNIRKIEPKYLN
ncbi:MAG: CehA/McbA family metallohydrolase [Candidatus Hydrogenedentes bacterium]|nr:CehA/McbA family metallohydrolase [Candidatus Hydrogenedentota bacterium]